MPTGWVVPAEGFPAREVAAVEVERVAVVGEAQRLHEMRGGVAGERLVAEVLRGREAEHQRGDHGEHGPRCGRRPVAPLARGGLGGCGIFDLAAHAGILIVAQATASAATTPS